MVNMIATPIRWILTMGIGLCGCFMIVSDDMQLRGFAFVLSALLWQGHYVAMMYEADWLRRTGKKMQENRGAPQLGGMASPAGEKRRV